jgi:hypothetical protein
MTNKNILFVVVIFLFFFGCNSSDSKNDLFEEHVKIALREVGNQLLLSKEDSTSLILPVLKIDESKYQLSFETALSFEPNNLVEIVKNSFKKSGFNQNYLVEVLNCKNEEVAYSYIIKNETEEDIIPCAGRFLPENCYQIRFKFLLIKPKTSSKNWLFYLLIPIFLGIFYRVLSTKKKNKILVEQNTAEHSNFGSFQFYPNQNKLIKEAQEIALSKKECEILQIFVANPNQIIKREELTKKVWEDNGVFVGRSLDTYISKLRKKLKEDTSIKLTNVHGVGYRLDLK